MDSISKVDATLARVAGRCRWIGGLPGRHRRKAGGGIAVVASGLDVATVDVIDLEQALGGSVPAIDRCGQLALTSSIASIKA